MRRGSCRMHRRDRSQQTPPDILARPAAALSIDFGVWRRFPAKSIIEPARQFRQMKARPAPLERAVRGDRSNTLGPAHVDAGLQDLIDRFSARTEQKRIWISTLQVTRLSLRPRILADGHSGRQALECASGSRSSPPMVQHGSGLVDSQTTAELPLLEAAHEVAYFEKPTMLLEHGDVVLGDNFARHPFAAPFASRKHHRHDQELPIA